MEQSQQFQINTQQQVSQNQLRTLFRQHVKTTNIGQFYRGKYINFDLVYCVKNNMTYFNACHLASKQNKQASKWLENKSNQAFIQSSFESLNEEKNLAEFCQVPFTILDMTFIVPQDGELKELRGTYLHLDLIVPFGIWVSPTYFGILTKMSHQLAIQINNRELELEQKLKDEQDKNSILEQQNTMLSLDKQKQKDKAKLRKTELSSKQVILQQKEIEINNKQQILNTKQQTIDQSTNKIDDLFVELREVKQMMRNNQEESKQQLQNVQYNLTQKIDQVKDEVIDVKRQLGTILSINREQRQNGQIIDPQDNQQCILVVRLQHKIVDENGVETIKKETVFHLLKKSLIKQKINEYKRYQLSYMIEPQNIYQDHLVFQLANPRQFLTRFADQLQITDLKFKRSHLNLKLVSSIIKSALSMIAFKQEQRIIDLLQNKKPVLIQTICINQSNYFVTMETNDSRIQILKDNEQYFEYMLRALLKNVTGFDYQIVDEQYILKNTNQQLINDFYEICKSNFKFSSIQIIKTDEQILKQTKQYFEDDEKPFDRAIFDKIKAIFLKFKFISLYRYPVELEDLNIFTK